MRLFVALELPEAVREALVAWRSEVADRDVWRFVDPEAIHLTLAFLGPRPESDVAAISSVLSAAVSGDAARLGDAARSGDAARVGDAARSGDASAALRAPRLVLGDALLLPPRRARVLCASVSDPAGVLAELQARVSAGLAAAGVYEPEKRPFRAHATVARLRPGARPPRSVAVSPEPLSFSGGPLTLFESRLHPHGARYEPLVQVPLA